MLISVLSLFIDVFIYARHLKFSIGIRPSLDHFWIFLQGGPVKRKIAGWGGLVSTYENIEEADEIE